MTLLSVLINIPQLCYYFLTPALHGNNHYETRKLHGRKSFRLSVQAQPNLTGKSNQTVHWDGKTPGLGLRVTASGAKSYIFQTDLNSKTIRITIGDLRTWSISQAQAEAMRLKVMTDQGIDPRQVRAEREAATTAKEQRKKIEASTLGEVWLEYIEARKPHWSERHYKDNLRMIHSGGKVRTRCEKLTIPGLLAPISNIRLIDLSTEHIERWAENETITRPTQARLAYRLLKAFLSWCMERAAYKTIITSNPAKNKAIREILGKPQAKNDSLQREQLSVWFAAVKQLHNPVISAYLQVLMLTRRTTRRNRTYSLGRY